MLGSHVLPRYPFEVVHKKSGKILKSSESDEGKICTNLYKKKLLSKDFFPICFVAQNGRRHFFSHSVPFMYFFLLLVAFQMYAITWQTNLISRLGEMDVFILLISCICHDLDHPGYNNVYQINAKTELALR